MSVIEKRICFCGRVSQKHGRVMERCQHCNEQRICTDGDGHVCFQCNPALAKKYDCSPLRDSRLNVEDQSTQEEAVMGRGTKHNDIYYGRR